MEWTDQIIRQIQKDSYVFGHFPNMEPILQGIGDAKMVLLGEATHGTSEFYTIRTEITKKLIQEKRFSFIGVEGDWPACYALNRYVKGYTNVSGAEEVLQAFNRWPTWMWANREVAELAEWLRIHNRDLPDEQKIGFYGLDMYSLWESIDEIIHCLDKTGSQELQAAKEAFSCLEPFERDGQKYGIAASFFSTPCEEEVVQLLLRLQQQKKLGEGDRESVLSTELNALVAVNAERYYRSMVKGGPESWNIRDTHMVEVIHRLMEFHGQGAKAIIWEHNTHIGDARATDMKEEGMVNVGQLLREQNPPNHVFAVGFGTHQGTVLAARGWGDDVEVMTIPPARSDSWEDLLHRAGQENKLIIFNQSEVAYQRQMGHRAIGVIYHPEFERGNYVPTILSKRYDAFVYMEKTSALAPLVVEHAYS